MRIPFNIVTTGDSSEDMRSNQCNASGAQRSMNLVQDVRNVIEWDVFKNVLRIHKLDVAYAAP